MSLSPYHALPSEKVFRIFHASEFGLTDEAVLVSRRQHGENRLPSSSFPKWPRILWQQVVNPFMVILAGASLASFFFGDLVDAGMILGAMAVNTLVGFIQEYKASNALAQLRTFLVQEAQVRRRGQVMRIPVSELVAGDLLLLESGDRISADARLVSVEALEVDEAILTGESLPVGKSTDLLKESTALAERLNMVYSGTTVLRGRAEAVVTAVGLQTELGRVAVMVSETESDVSPLQEQFARLGRSLSVLYVSMAVGIFILGLLFGYSLGEMFVLSIALAVAAVPEGLLVAVTVVLAIGMQRMLKRRALVRRLVATETLGSVSVICTDKTGTITQASMQVSSLITPSHEQSFSQLNDLGQEKEILRTLEIGVLCNDAVIHHPQSDLRPDRFIGSPTESALLEAGEMVGYDSVSLRKNIPRIFSLPFDSTQKFMLVVVETSSERELLIKGAVERVLSASTHAFVQGEVVPLTENLRARLSHDAEVMAERGLRVLGLGFRRFLPEEQIKSESVRDMVFTGMIGLRDPVRPEAKSTIAYARQAGVRTVIVTGDHPRTALAIAKEVELRDHLPRVLTGYELDALSDEQLIDRVEEIDVYARVEPHHKVRIVRAWRARGETVAMIGDGVNDAPAIKSADIGVAQGAGTDVTKQVADMVLLDGNLSTVVSAIEEGRVIFDNIRKTTAYLLVNGFSEMVLIILGLLFHLPLPLLAVQILFLNFVTDSFPAIALTMDPAEPEAMREAPRPRKTPILTGRMKGFVFGCGIARDLLPFFYYAWMLHQGVEVERARTVLFVLLSLQTLLVAFSIRTYRRSIFRVSLFQNRWLLLAVGFAGALTIFALFFEPLKQLLSLSSIGLMDWGVFSMILLVELLLLEGYKYFVFIRPRTHHAV